MTRDEERERRLADALRANLRRRKQQQRGAPESAAPGETASGPGDEERT